MPLPPFDPFHEDFRRDPYSAYARYREEDPVHLGVPPMPSMPRCWYLFRYRDVSRALHDDRLGRGRGSAVAVTGGAPTSSTVIRRVARRMVLFADPPRHDRLRRAIEVAWSPEITQRVSEQTRLFADQLLAGLLRETDADLMSDFCVPLPVLVMAEALGVPERHRLRIKRWSTDIVALTDLHQDAAIMEDAARATAEVVEYLRELLAHRRRNPGPDLLSRMAALTDTDARLDDDEILANSVLLLAAGHETTVGLLGNGIMALLREPAWIERLRSRPALIPRAVEEALRYDSPIQMTFRLVQEDVTIGDHTLKRGQAVALVLGSANRDPAVFGEPDRFNPERAPNAHMAFGGGRHICYGAGLARREGRVAFARIVNHLPHMSMLREPEWAANFLFRSLRSLPVSVGSAAAGNDLAGEDTSATGGKEA